MTQSSHSVTRQQALADRRCLVCMRSFVAGRRDAFLCSDRCRDRWRRFMRIRFAGWNR